MSTARRQTLEDAEKPAQAPWPRPPANDGRQGRGGGGGLNSCTCVTRTTSSHIQVFPPRQEHALVDAPSTAPVKARTTDKLPRGPGSRWSQQGGAVAPAVTLRRNAHTRVHSWWRLSTLMGGTDATPGWDATARYQQGHWVQSTRAPSFCSFRRDLRRLRPQCTRVRTAAVDRSRNSKCGSGCGQEGTLLHGGSVAWSSPHGEQRGGSLH